MTHKTMAIAASKPPSVGKPFRTPEGNPAQAREYVETFDQSPGGWIGSNGNADGHTSLHWTPGIIRARSPWWVDYNHAPPGAGYLHILYTLHTMGPFGEHLMETGGPNAFTSGGFSTDFRDVDITVRLKGELLTRGSQLLLLIQGKVGRVVSSWLLTAQPVEVHSEWSEQTIHLSTREEDWLWLGARRERSDFYGYLPLSQILSDVNVNILFVLFPLEIKPMGEPVKDIHGLRAGKDYPLWRHCLPEGYIDLDTVKITFPPHAL